MTSQTTESSGPAPERTSPGAGPIVFSIFLAIAFLAHAVLTTAIVSPINVASVRLSNASYWYQRVNFQQSWSLFAPEPINDEKILLVRGRFVSGDSEETTDWIDVSSGLVSQEQRIRGFASREYRIPMTVLQSLSWQDPWARKLRERLGVEALSDNESPPDDGESTGTRDPASEKEALSKLLPYEMETLEQSVSMMYRLGEETLKKTFPDGKFDQIQMRIAVNAFPAFSERHLPDSEGTVTVRDLPWIETK